MVIGLLKYAKEFIWMCLQSHLYNAEFFNSNKPQGYMRTAVTHTQAHTAVVGSKFGPGLVVSETAIESVVRLSEA